MQHIPYSEARFFLKFGSLLPSTKSYRGLLLWVRWIQSTVTQWRGARGDYQLTSWRRQKWKSRERKL